MEGRIGVLVAYLVGVVIAMYLHKITVTDGDVEERGWKTNGDVLKLYLSSLLSWLFVVLAVIIAAYWALCDFAETSSWGKKKVEE